MLATFNKSKSWEKQSCWTLENGVIATLEYSHYGNHIVRLEDKTGYWHCSSGIRSLPERFHFALAWQECVVKSSQTLLIRPHFTPKDGTPTQKM